MAAAYGRAAAALLTVALLGASMNVMLRAVAAQTPPGPPPLATFSSYEEMERYVAARAARPHRHLDNPTGDSYLHAFNEHNEQQAAPNGRGPAPIPPLRRARRHDTPPQRRLPSEPAKLFRFEIADAVEPSDALKALIRQHRSRELAARPRSRRAAPHHFPVEFIRFEVADAREPSEETKALIKRMRALELVEPTSPPSPRTTRTPTPRSTPTTGRPTRARAKTRRRVRRTAPQTPPQMIRFELEDAKEPHPALKSRLLQQRQAKALSTPTPTPTPTLEPSAGQEAGNASGQAAADQGGGESKRLYVYKQSPLKLKKSLNSLPTGVQKAISSLLKPDAKPAYAKLQPIVAAPAPAPALPVRYVYTQHGHAQLSPGHGRAPSEPQELGRAFRPSKPDPLQAGAGLAVDHFHQQNHLELVSQPELATAPAYIKVEYHHGQLPHNYQEQAEFQQLSALMGKSPHDQMHGLAYLLAKQMQARLQRQRHEQQQYYQQLVAVAEAEGEPQPRPQDSTGPMLFPADQGGGRPRVRPSLLGRHATLGVQPGPLIGMAKSKDYIPIVDTSATPEPEPEPEPQPEPQPEPKPHSFIEYGLTAAPPQPQGQLLRLQPHPQPLKLLPLAPTAHPEALLQPHQPQRAPSAYEQQYASKYAFGYRIRDFHTGNDFGHKQNRDLDGVTRGQYHILLPDGRIQNVIYHADDTGFHADVSFEVGH